MPPTFTDDFCVEIYENEKSKGKETKQIRTRNQRVRGGGFNPDSNIKLTAQTEKDSKKTKEESKGCCWYVK